MDNINTMDDFVRGMGNGGCVFILIMYLISVVFIIYYNQPTSTYQLITTSFICGLGVFIIKVSMKLFGL